LDSGEQQAVDERRPDSSRGPGRSQNRWAIRPVTAVIVAVLVAGTIGVAALSRQVVRDQEQRLLERRAAEASALLSLSTSRSQELFRSLSTLVQLTGLNEEAFSRSVQPAVAARVFGAVAVVQKDGSGYKVVMAEGDGLAVGQPAPSAAAATLERAGVDGTLVFTSVRPAGDTRRIGFAALVPGLPTRTLIYGESVLGPAVSAEGRPESGPFGDLDGALYAGQQIDPGQLITGTAGFRGTGRTAESKVPVGADQWLLVVSPRHALVGPLAQRQPWMFLAGGLLASLLVAALVETLSRRRRYADALVTERTAQLQESLQELDAAQQRLVTQERLAAIGQLASAVGHELRNPLGVLSNVVYLLATKLGREDPWLDRQLRTAEREVGAATLIVSDLLEFARPRDPIFGEVDLPTLVEEVLSVVPAPDGVQLARRWPADLPALRGDRDQLRQVLLNLVTNAYDAMVDGGLLALEAERHAEGVLVTVGDTGTGIDPDIRGRLFEPFFTTKAKGIGLGLAVTHRIVEGHGGSIDVRSQLGSGAVFRLTLPAAVVPAPVGP
jgi:signal transduction histidine kinase